MASTLTDKYCVRIKLLDDRGMQINQGSGILIKKSSEYFLLTARHCLKISAVAGDSLAKTENIRVEKQQFYNGPFEQIEVQEILDSNSEQDWAILKVSAPVASPALADTTLGEYPRIGDEVFFRGYQGVSNIIPRSFDAKINNAGPGEFIISLRGDTFNQGGELGADIARGLSGSGVFLMRNDRIYLVGHLKSVIGEMALNNDIKCCAVGFWKKLIPNTSCNLSRDENLPWDEDRRNLNDILIRRLFDGLREFKQTIADLGMAADERPEFWLEPQFLCGVQKAVADNYLGVLGIQITKLISISKDNKYDRECQKEYLDRVYIAAKRTIQLLSFIFFSKFWDHQGNRNIRRLAPREKLLINDFFDKRIEPGLTDFFKIIMILVDIYVKNPTIDPPVEELETLQDQFRPDTNFAIAFKELDHLKSKITAGTYTLTDCFEAELHLATILETLAFLSRYKMASIRSAKYQQVRNRQGNYQHSYLELAHFERKITKGQQKLEYISTPASTDAVIFYLQDYTAGTNLCPFVIDLNTLNSDDEEGCQIYFYQSRHFIKKEILTYFNTAIEGDSMIEIEDTNLPAKVPGVIDILMDPALRVVLQKDGMHRLFMEARQEILALL